MNSEKQIVNTSLDEWLLSHQHQSSFQNTPRKVEEPPSVVDRSRSSHRIVVISRLERAESNKKIDEAGVVDYFGGFVRM